MNTTAKLPLGASEPLLSAARQRAATGQDSIRMVTFGFGPIGTRGFRRGWWAVERNGERRQVFASVPHNLPLWAQDRRICASAALAWAIEDLRAEGHPENDPS